MVVIVWFVIKLIAGGKSLFRLAVEILASRAHSRPEAGVQGSVLAKD